MVCTLELPALLAVSPMMPLPVEGALGVAVPLCDAEPSLVPADGAKGRVVPLPPLPEEVAVAVLLFARYRWIR